MIGPVKKYCFVLITCLCVHVASAQSSVIASIKNSDATVFLRDGSVSNSIKVTRKWNGDFCATLLTNTSGKDVHVKEVVLMQANHLFDSSTGFYAEGFQMLSQYSGTLGSPKPIAYFDDSKHYKLTPPDGYKVVYNMLLLHNANSEILIGFNSSFRFIGKFYLSADTIKVVMDMDNTLLKAGTTIQLEECSLLNGKNIAELTAKFAQRINHFHLPRSTVKHTPEGWCSWYCFGPDVTAKNITDNLEYIKANIPQLKYIQLDDGYQPHMGDWLETAPYFGGSIKDMLLKIKAAGFEPAIWVAPFICDSNSTVFKQHPDWLVHDSTGQPLRSDKVSFGGWRLGPWYVLDGTNPETQKHLTHVFKTMSQEWGVTYFKLDANYWGAIQGGVYYDKNATRVTAYREGMEAVIKGAGNAFILGCNHPLWPSLGLIDGSRSSMDISREWNSFSSTANENLLRAWQNGKLWWNDPDCILLTGDLTEDEFMFHASVIFSTGGMKLSGDDLTKISSSHLAILNKVAAQNINTASFNNDMNIGWINAGNISYLILLNKEEQPKKFDVPLSSAYTITNYWTDEVKGDHKNKFSDELPAHCGRVYKLVALKSK